MIEEKEGGGCFEGIWGNGQGLQAFRVYGLGLYIRV